MDDFESNINDLVDLSKTLPIFSLINVLHDLATLVNGRVGEIRVCRNRINEIKYTHSPKELVTNSEYKELREELSRLSNERDCLKAARSTINKMYNALLPEFSVSGITTYRQLEDNYNEK